MAGRQSLRQRGLSGEKPLTIADVLEHELDELYDAEVLRAASDQSARRVREAAQRAARRWLSPNGSAEKQAGEGTQL